MADNATLDPQDIFMSIGEIIIQGGLAEGTFVEIEYESDLFTDVVGSDGVTARAKTNDGRATVKFSVLQTAPVNGLLSALMNVDQSAPNGAGIAPLLVQNHRDGSTYFGEEAWIMKRPSVAYGNEIKVVDWEVRVGNLSFQLNGG